MFWLLNVQNEYWDSEVLYQLILKSKENAIDSNRIYLTDWVWAAGVPGI
jgi:hypothetical protein